MNDTANGTWTITHPSESHSDATGSAVIVERDTDDTTCESVEVSASSKTQVIVKTLQQIHGQTNGASVLSDLSAAMTRTWNGTDTDVIAHPAVSSSFSASVAPYGANGYTPVITSLGASSLSVRYLDVAAGTYFTGAARPGANFTFTRGGLSPCALTGSNKFKVERSGKCKVNATNVAGGTANIWVMGMMEVS